MDKKRYQELAEEFVYTLLGGTANAVDFRYAEEFLQEVVQEALTEVEKQPYTHGKLR